MTTIIQGPLLTRKEAARRAGIDPRLLPDRPDLIHLGGQWLEEVYCAFQFDDHGVRPDVGLVVQSLKPAHADEVLADWMARPNPDLNGISPLDYLSGAGSPGRVLDAASHFAPDVPTPEVADSERALAEPRGSPSSPRPKRSPRNTLAWN